MASQIPEEDPREVPEEAPDPSGTGDATIPGLPGIVGIGASAGGLEALSEMFEEVPADTGMAFVVIQHLAPDRESAMVAILSGKTEMAVREARDGTVLEPDTVFVAPPGFLVEIVGGAFRLAPRPKPPAPSHPIDHFFESLAVAAGGRAIAVVLSGTASDGACGAREVKSVGGIVLVQDPETARYDGMPRAAMATGAVDLVLPPRRIAAEIGSIAAHPYLRPAAPKPTAEELELQASQLERIFALLRRGTGVDFTHYKSPTIRRRLQRRMILNKISDVATYLTYLESNATEVRALYQDILIHVTRFFREPESFEALREIVFPRFAERRREGQPLRIWIPGCSTGEEPYSIAIAMLEFLGEEVGSSSLQIFATDISEAAIEIARRGIYPESIAADVSVGRLRRFFGKVDGSFRVSKTVREQCVFARQDLTRDPPFRLLDLVVCRNVLIYMGAPLQARMMQTFHYALKPEGYLMLGRAETVGQHPDLFALVDKRHRIYSKRAVDIRQPVVGQGSFAPVRGDETPFRGLVPRAIPTIQSEVSRYLLDRFTPAGIVIDEDFQIIQFRGRTGLYLEPASGDPTLHLLKMAREGLLHALRDAVDEVKRTGTGAIRQGVSVRSNGGRRLVDLEVIPLHGSTDRNFLILFLDHRDELREEAGPIPEALPGPPESEQVNQLREELASTRGYLQSIIQDAEAANEELQSANEEILSANEELQSTNEELDTAKEELQSINEELNTLNEELQTRNEELSCANSDLLNLFASVPVAIVIVTMDLRIRRFTPMAEQLLNLIATDVGRPIAQINPNVECPEIDRLIAESIESTSTVEREVRSKDGRWFALRIRPYKDSDNRIDGAVLSLHNIDPERRERELARRTNLLIETVLACTSEPIAVVDAQRRFEKANEPFAVLFGKRVCDLVGLSISDPGGPLGEPRLAAELAEVFEEAKLLRDRSVATGDGRTLQLNAVPLRSLVGEVDRVVIAMAE